MRSALVPLLVTLVIDFTLPGDLPAAFGKEAPLASSTVVQGTGGGLNVRARPGLDFAVVGVLPEGSRAEIVGGPFSDARWDWFRLKGADERGVPVRGWAIGTYLIVAGSAPSADAARTFVAEIRGYASGGEVGGYTATGKPVRWGTVAVDPSQIALGSLLTIDGLEGTFEAEDVGATIRGPQLDVWFPDIESALQWGVQRRRVTVLREGR